MAVQNPPRICDIEPFVSQVQSQPGSLEEAATALSLFQDEVVEYLTRLREALCDDVQGIINDCCPEPGISP